MYCLDLKNSDGAGTCAWTEAQARGWLATRDDVKGPIKVKDMSDDRHRVVRTLSGLRRR